MIKKLKCFSESKLFLTELKTSVHWTVAGMVEIGISNVNRKMCEFTDKRLSFALLSSPFQRTHTTTRVTIVVMIHDNLLTHSRHITMRKLLNYIFLLPIQTTSESSKIGRILENKVL